MFNRSFKKIRQNGKIKETESSKLQKKRSEILQLIKKDPNNQSLKDELEEIISQLTILVSEQNRDKIVETFKKLDQSDGDNFSAGIWKIKKKEFPKSTKSVPAAKVDVNGRLVSDPIGLKKLYSDTFMHRLRQRPIKEEYSHLFDLQKLLLEKRLVLTKSDKSPDWTEEDIIAVLKSLKNDKCRDPLGLINEIFKPNVAGVDLIKSITLMMNRIKFELYVPKLFRLKNITAIYKNKGSKLELENDRGIFTCTVPNTILQKLILKDNYENIDRNLSDSNVGARKGKNIRNNSFIINGIIQDTLSSKSSKSIDLAILDYRQCFDALAVDIGTNDLYNVGVTNDQLNLIYECDSLSSIAVKTPLGLTERKDIEKIVAQGEVASSLKCTVTVDSIAEKHEDNLSDHLYKYKDVVPVPPLGMVDDQVGVANCGLDSALSTCHLNTQTNIKKLQFGQNKCHKLHIGKTNSLCTHDFIDTWKLQRNEEVVSSILDLKDVEGQEHEIEIFSSDCYLGDVIQSNGKNDLNIKEREGRGSGAVKQILNMLNDLCLGEYHFEVANILRSSFQYFYQIPKVGTI